MYPRFSQAQGKTTKPKNIRRSTDDNIQIDSSGEQKAMVAHCPKWRHSVCNGVVGMACSGSGGSIYKVACDCSAISTITIVAPQLS